MTKLDVARAFARAVLGVAALAWGGAAPGQDQLFADPLEQTADPRWALEPGWAHVPSEQALVGEGHVWARLAGGGDWADYRLRLRLALLGGGVHLNFRVSEHGRYLVGFGEDLVYLAREQPWGQIRELAAVEWRIAPDRWYSVEIAGDGGAITVTLDGEPVLQATDPDPLPPGGIAFETLDDSVARVSSVEVETLVAAEAEEGYEPEEYPVWKRPDLAVTAVRVEPERVDPGELVTIVVSAANRGTGTTVPSRVALFVDGEPLRYTVVPPLGPAETFELRARWRAEVPGRHRVLAELVFPDTGFDAEVGNDRIDAVIRVSGEPNPEPEVEATLLEEQAADSLGPLRLRLRNPGFAEVRDVGLAVRLDGEPVAARTLDRLASGESMRVDLDLVRVAPGEHVLELELQHPPRETQGRRVEVRSWHLVVPAPTQLFEVKSKHRWVSLGPRLIGNQFVGRLHKIALHPSDPDTLYVSTPRGGLWKTESSGKSWIPLGDKLPNLFGSAVTLDPKQPEIVYYATGFSHDPSGTGLYKSLNGGKDWLLFASAATMGGANVLHVARTTAGKVLVYAATNRGLLRYLGTDPRAKTSLPADWEVIKSGQVRDLAVHPTDASLVYASVRDQGLWRSRKSTTAKQDDASWEQLDKGLPGTAGGLAIDVYRAAPKVLYASYRSSCPACYIELFKSTDEGASWTKILQKNDNPKRSNDTQYNPFVRVHPAKPIVYYGGGRLYKAELVQGKWKEVEVSGAHVDLHELVFDPHRADGYYQLNDGGIWRSTAMPGANDAKTALNRDLRVTELYDFDVSKTNPALMIGGTQDNGTILTQGGPDWTRIRGGDGNYSVIALPDKILYSQDQKLTTTRRSDRGAQTKNADWKPKGKVVPQGLPSGYSMRNAWFVVHPKDGDHLLSQGDQVYSSTDGGLVWDKKGPNPQGKGVKAGSTIARVVVQPKTHDWIAGNTRGQIWYKAHIDATWSLAFAHPFDAAVSHLAFAPTNPDVLFAGFDATGPYAYTRVWRLERSSATGGSWSVANVTDNLPALHVPGQVPLKVRVIAGDAFSDNVAYVGTARGVFRGTAACGTCYWSWKPYNEGLPLAIVNDLVVVPQTGELRAATQGRGVWAAVTGP